MPIMCFCIWDDNKKSSKTAMRGLMTTPRKEWWPRTELQGRTAPWLDKQDKMQFSVLLHVYPVTTLAH